MISKQIIQVNSSFTSNGEEYFMCSFSCDIPKTTLTNVKNCTFERCNLSGCEVDGTNTLIKSNVYDTTPLPIEKYTDEEEKDARIVQLEKHIMDGGGMVPKVVKAVI